MKVDLDKLLAAANRNLKASAELTGLVEGIRKFIPPEDRDEAETEVIEVVKLPGKREVKLIGDGKKPRKKHWTKARKTALKKLLRWNATHKEEPEYCKVPIDPRSIYRHRISCRRKRRQKGLQLVETVRTAPKQGAG